MKASKRRARCNDALDAEAAELTTAIRGHGRYDHVTVKAARGFLYVNADDEPVVRLKPLSGAKYGLSFHHHSGRWDPTPFTGDIVRVASILTTEFEPYLASYDFRPGKSGSDH